MRSPVMTKFDHEKARAGHLLERMGIAAESLVDPNSGGTQESGADVVAIIDGRKVGIQVTDIDTGSRPGQARAAEVRLSEKAITEGTTYFVWGQNDSATIIDRIGQTVARKARISVAGFDDFWLLMCGGVPEFGAVGATMIMTPWLETGALNARTTNDLASSNYTRAFIDVILGVEEKALYEWRRDAGWSKSTVALPPAEQAPDFWAYKDDPDLLADPEGWRDREIERVLTELRQSGS
jgi:hypothetical protein